MAIKIKGKIVKSRSESKDRGSFHAVFLESKGGESYELSQDFSMYIGNKITIKIK